MCSFGGNLHAVVGLGSRLICFHVLAAVLSKGSFKLVGVVGEEAGRMFNWRYMAPLLVAVSTSEETSQMNRQKQLSFSEVESCCVLDRGRLSRILVVRGCWSSVSPGKVEDLVIQNLITWNQ